MEALELTYVIGNQKGVKMVDFSEFNPAVEASRSGELLARMFFNFTQGISERA